MESPSATPALKRAFGISYATLRFSATLKHGVLASHLEGYALRIAEEVAVADYEQAAKTIKGMESLARLAGSVGIMKSENSQALIAELHKLADDIAGIGNGVEADIADFIKKSSEDFAKPSGNVSGNERQKIRQKPLPHAEESLKKSDPSQEVRQAAILERIRQLGNCRLKDFQDILPNVSERTIRYDLQRLAEQGIVDRVGAGGPFSHYRLRTRILPHDLTSPQPIPNAPPVDHSMTPGVS